jgi:hypothetical protein
MNKILCLLLFTSVLTLDGYSQNIIIHQTDSGLVNECYLNDTLIKKSKPLFDDAMHIIYLLKDKKYDEIEREFKKTFGNSSFTMKEIKEKTKWASDLINRYGIPKPNKIKFCSSFPVEWYLQNKKENNGEILVWSLSFKFEYPDDKEKVAKNIISISYCNHSTPIIQDSFGRFSIDFDNAKEHQSIQDLIDNASPNK